MSLHDRARHNREKWLIYARRWAGLNAVIRSHCVRNMILVLQDDGASPVIGFSRHSHVVISHSNVGSVCHVSTYIEVGNEGRPLYRNRCRPRPTSSERHQYASHSPPAMSLNVPMKTCYASVYMPPVSLWSAVAVSGIAMYSQATLKLNETLVLQFVLGSHQA